MENYETLMDELTRLNIQKQAVAKQMHEIEEKLNKIKEEKATKLYNEIDNKIRELVSLGYHFEIKIWDNDCGSYDWYDTVQSPAFRLRQKDEVIVD